MTDMLHFSVIAKATGQEVYRYQYEAPVEFEDYPFADFDHVLAPDEQAAAPAPLPLFVWTPAGFLKRFSQDERIAVRELARADSRIEDFVHLLDRAEEVRSDDPDTLGGLARLTELGVLAEGRMAEILGAA